MEQDTITTILNEDLVNVDESYDSDMSSDTDDKLNITLQAFQVSIQELDVYECTTVEDLYWYHFEERTNNNDFLFNQLLDSASEILNQTIALDHRIYDIANKL